MPKRMLDGDITTSKSLNRVSAGAERTFFRLVTLCDDRGRYHGNRELLKSHLYPLGIATLDEVNEWLAELEREGCIHPYVLEGEPYIHLPNWEKFQRLRNYKPKFPDPEEECESCNNPPLTAAKSGQPRPRTELNRTEEEQKRTSQLLRSSTRPPPASQSPQPKPVPIEASAATEDLIRVIPLSMPGSSVPARGSARFNRWAREIDRLKRLDNSGAWTWEEINAVLNWLPTHDDGEFAWGRVIRSAKKLRQHFPMLMAAMQNEGRERPKAETEDARNLRELKEAGAWQQ